MNGVSLQVNLPDCGQYNPEELTQVLTKIALRLIGKETQVSDFDDFPCVYSVEEAKALVLQRGRDIKAHDEVMDEMEQLIASYAD